MISEDKELFENFDTLWAEPQDREVLLGLLKEVIPQRMRVNTLVAQVRLHGGCTLHIYEGSIFIYRIGDESEPSEQPLPCAAPDRHAPDCECGSLP